MSAARKLLAAIRIVNGAAALVAPRVVAGRLGADSPSGETLYGLRLFGVRTVAIGLDLLRRDASAIRWAPLIHASDLYAALAAAREGVPEHNAHLVQIISGLNTMLAVLAQLERR